jgi:hypothetical protein
MTALDALNRVTKWRGLFAGWQLGTRPKGDPECDAVRDHREVTIILRVEASAIIGVLLSKGVITQDEWENALAMEADQLSAAYADRFPGVTASDHGLIIDPRRAPGWMKGWKP